MNNNFFKDNEDLINIWEELIFKKLDSGEYKDGLDLLQIYEQFCNKYDGKDYFKDMFVNINWGTNSEHYGQEKSLIDVFNEGQNALNISIN